MQVRKVDVTSNIYDDDYAEEEKQSADRSFSDN